MLFSSLVFIYAFLPLVCLLYFAIPSIKVKNYILCIASIFFYAYGEPRFVWVMLGSIFMNYAFGLVIQWLKNKGKPAKIVLVLACIANITLLFVYKYLGFVSRVLENFGIGSTLHILLPIGISFFTFQAMSYVVDVYRGTVQAQKNPVYIGLYIAFFPQLIAGPIVRYNSIATQIEYREHSLDNVRTGFMRFLLGLFKKVLLANQLAIVADIAFNNTVQISTLMAWLGLIAYALQIFFDFAGYSDMAIGLARIFGFALEENFLYPYISKSISEFWRRWHISLGIWFRDYLYFPLGGSQGKLPKTICNLAIVWLCTGIWHGANFTFALWGLYYFIFIAIEKLLALPKTLPTRFAKNVYAVCSMFFVLLGWVLFRANNLSHAGQYYTALFGGTEIFGAREFGLLQSYAWVILLGLLFTRPIIPWLVSRCPEKLQRFAQLLQVPIYIALFITVTAMLVTGVYNPFIYFQF